MHFSRFAQQSISRRILRPGTVEEYERLLRVAEPHLGQLHVGRIEQRHVQRCLASAREEGLGEKSVRNLLALVNSVLREAGSDAAAGVRVRVPDPDLAVLTAEQAQQLDARLEELDTLEARALRVCLGTGLRRGELLALKARDWKAGQQQVHVGRSTSGPTKSGRARDVDVPTALVAEFSRAAADSRGRALYPVHPRALGRYLRRVTDELGLPPVRIHDLRHTRITLQLLAEVPVLYVSQQAGHGSPAFTMSRYGHLVVATPTQRREWADAS